MSEADSGNEDSFSDSSKDDANVNVEKVLDPNRESEIRSRPSSIRNSTTKDEKKESLSVRFAGASENQRKSDDRRDGADQESNLRRQSEAKAEEMQDTKQRKSDSEEGEGKSKSKNQRESEEQDGKKSSKTNEERKESTGRKSKKSRADVEVVDRMRHQYHQANPIPYHSIGIFYTRSEAIRGPGRPMDMAAACYAKPKREMIQKNKNFRRRYYTDFC